MLKLHKRSDKHMHTRIYARAHTYNRDDHVTTEMVACSCARNAIYKSNEIEKWTRGFVVRRESSSHFFRVTREWSPQWYYANTGRTVTEHVLRLNIHSRISNHQHDRRGILRQSSTSNIWILHHRVSKSDFYSDTLSCQTQYEHWIREKGERGEEGNIIY